jgi:hypothetical protein
LGSPGRRSLVSTGQARNLGLRSLHVTIQGGVVGKELRMLRLEASSLVAVRPRSKTPGTYRPRSRSRSTDKAWVIRQPAGDTTGSLVRLLTE